MSYGGCVDCAFLSIGRSNRNNLDPLRVEHNPEIGSEFTKVEVFLAESGSARTDCQYLICWCLNYTIRQCPQHIEDHLQVIVTSTNC